MGRWWAVASFALAGAVLMLAACGSNTWTDDQGDAGTGITPEALADPPSCADLVGLPTNEVTDQTFVCLDDGALTINMTMFYDCPDGRALHWNEYGWGYSDSSWQAHARADGQLVPPQADLDACSG